MPGVVARRRSEQVGGGESEDAREDGELLEGDGAEATELAGHRGASDAECGGHVVLNHAKPGHLSA